MNLADTSMVSPETNSITSLSIATPLSVSGAKSLRPSQATSEMITTASTNAFIFKNFLISIIFILISRILFYVRIGLYLPVGDRIKFSMIVPIRGFIPPGTSCKPIKPYQICSTFSFKNKFTASFN